MRQSHWGKRISELLGIEGMSGHVVEGESFLRISRSNRHMDIYLFTDGWGGMAPKVSVFMSYYAVQEIIYPEIKNSRKKLMRYGYDICKTHQSFDAIGCESTDKSVEDFTYVDGLREAIQDVYIDSLLDKYVVPESLSNSFSRPKRYEDVTECFLSENKIGFTLPYYEHYLAFKCLEGAEYFMEDLKLYEKFIFTFDPKQKYFVGSGYWERYTRPYKLDQESFIERLKEYYITNF